MRDRRRAEVISDFQVLIDQRELLAWWRPCRCWTAIAALPPKHRRLMVNAGGVCASHRLITRLDQLASRAGGQLLYSEGWDLGPYGHMAT